MNKKKTGNLGESRAVTYLKGQGFAVIETNFRCRMGEIDVIAQKNGEIFFVEVKTRRSTKFGSPLEAVTLRKQRQIVKIAKYYLQRQKKVTSCHFSVIGILLASDGTHELTFIPNAFEAI